MSTDADLRLARALGRISYWAKCHACGTEWLSSVPASVLSQHEDRYHDGAQTCWTRADEIAGREAVTR